MYGTVLLKKHGYLINIIFAGSKVRNVAKNSPCRTQLQILKYRVLEESEKSFKLEGDDFQHMTRKGFFLKKTYALLRLTYVKIIIS